MLAAAGSPVVTDTTGAMGTYSLTGFGAGSYTITPSKSGGVNGAISAFDSARLVQYITSNDPNLTAAQQFVADVSGTGGISSFDAALIARYVAGLGTLTGSTGNWIFNPTSNFHASVATDVTGEDYSALLMGDVTGNWGDPSPFRPAIGGFGPERSAVVRAPRLSTATDKDIIVPIAIRGAANKDIISYEFDLRYDPSVIQPQARPAELAGTVSDALSVIANATEPGLLKIVAYGASPLNADGVLLNLRFTAIGAPGSVSPLTWERIVLNEGEPQASASDGTVELSGSVSNQAEISGRLLTAFGAGVPNARVTLTDVMGRTRSIRSNGFGLYRFGGLQAGQIYTISVARRNWDFTPLTVSVTDRSISVDLIAAE